MQRRDELIRVPEDLVGDECDKVETGDEAAHLVFLVNLDAELLLKEVVHEVSATARRHELDALAHVLDRDAIDGGRAFDEFAQEADTVVNIVRFKLDEVEPASRQSGG